MNQNTNHPIIGRYLQFRLETEQFGIPLLQVREVIAMPKLTTIPSAPDFCIGIMNLRGQVVTIFDLKKKIGIKSSSNIKSTVVMILDIGNQIIGVSVDEVDKVFTVADSSSFDDSIANPKQPYLLCTYKSEKGLIILFDMKSLFNSKNTIAA